MTTLKELQLANPIGTKFRWEGWPHGHYIYFDGICWRDHRDGYPAVCDHAGWEVCKEPHKVVRYINLYKTKDENIIHYYHSGFFYTRESADIGADGDTDKRIACVRIELEEGRYDP